MKVLNAISAIILTALLWYGIYVYFFVGPIVWLGNIIMFYMNLSFFIYFLGLFMNNEKKMEVKKQKFFHWSIDAFKMVVLAFIFAAFGWWYYAVICTLSFIFIIIIFKED